MQEAFFGSWARQPHFAGELLAPLQDLNHRFLDLVESRAGDWRRPDSLRLPGEATGRVAPLTAAPLGGARAATYEFLAAPQTDLNRVFRLDKVTGEVGACQYGLKDGSPFGVTLCYPAGEGAKAGPAGEYALVASRHTGEAGVFRVDLRTGFMSICFVLNETSVVCTTPAK